MASVGIGELKNALSAMVRRAEAGETITITVQGRAVARLGPARSTAAAEIREPLDAGVPTEGWTVYDLPVGTAAAWVDQDRDEP